MAPRFPEPTRLLQPHNALLGDRSACADHWSEHGCLLLRDVLDAELVAAARRELTERLGQQGAVISGAAEPVWSGSGVSAIDAFSLYEGDPLFVALAHSAALRAVLEAVHGESIHVYQSVQIRFALPGDELHTIPMHQDARYIEPDSQFCAFWIPLVDIAPGEGGLAVVPRSHRSGLLPHVVSTEYYSYYMGEERPQRCIPLDQIEGEWVGADFKAGDLLLFDSFVVHSALPNRSRLVRLSIDGRYQRAARPLLNWQARYSVRTGTERRQAVLDLLGGRADEDADRREAVIAAVLAGDLPVDAATVDRLVTEYAVPRR